MPGPFKSTLIRDAKLLIYTPTNEHFGIVPVEAMLHGVPILAANTGGPLETVVDGQTGWLRDVKDVGAWTDAMAFAVDDANAAQMVTIGQAGRRRVESEFSRTKMAQRLDDEIEEMRRMGRRAFLEWTDVVLGLGVLGVCLAALALTIVKSSAQIKPPKKYAKLSF